jgi:hypothetical protein
MREEENPSPVMLILSNELIELCIFIVTVVCTVYLKEISHCLNPCLATKLRTAVLSHLICDIVTPNCSSSTKHASEDLHGRIAVIHSAFDA